VGVRLGRDRILLGAPVPVWEWLDPFATIHDILAWVLRTLGVRGWRLSVLPEAARAWPAVVGLVVLRVARARAGRQPRDAVVVLVGYTLLTLALMAQFGRDEWRAQGETFTVWFRTLNRLAPLGVVPATRTGGADAEPDAVDATVLERRPFATGLLRGPWSMALVALAAVGVASIIFDGLSQTVAFASVFGAPGPRAQDAAPARLAHDRRRRRDRGRAAGERRRHRCGAGADRRGLPHRPLPDLPADQRPVRDRRGVDPLQQGWDLFGTAFFLPTYDWLPPGLVWTAQLAAVVGRPHDRGVGRARDRAARHGGAGLAPDPRHAPSQDPRATNGEPRDVRMREIPLAS
jgi:hypothetical protein